MRAIRREESIRIYDSYMYRESIKEIEGRMYDAEDKCWIVPLCEENVATLSLIGANLDEELSELSKLFFPNTNYWLRANYKHFLDIFFNLECSCYCYCLVQKVHSIAFRIKIEDAVDLPPFIDETRVIPLESKAKSVYKQLEKDCYAELNHGDTLTSGFSWNFLTCSALSLVAPHISEYSIFIPSSTFYWWNKSNTIGVQSKISI